MTPQALAALKESIAHWERVTSGTMRKGESVGWPHCALCQQFNNNYGAPDGCDGCPVKEKTGLSGCQCTPYVPFENNVINMEEDELNLWLVTPEARALAASELDFLKSLLPVEK